MLIDGNELYNIEKLLDTEIIQKSPEASWLLSQVLHDIQASPEIDPESLPVVKQLRAELKKMKAERDAAVNDLHKTVLDCGVCNACEHQFKECVGVELCDFDGEDYWEWRGIKEG